MLGWCSCTSLAAMASSSSSLRAKCRSMALCKRSTVVRETSRLPSSTSTPYLRSKVQNTCEKRPTAARSDCDMDDSWRGLTLNRNADGDLDFGFVSGGDMRGHTDSSAGHQLGGAALDFVAEIGDHFFDERD